MSKVSVFLSILLVAGCSFAGYYSVELPTSTTATNGVTDVQYTRALYGRVVAINYDITSGATGTVKFLTVEDSGASLGAAKTLLSNRTITASGTTNLAANIYLAGDRVGMTTTNQCKIPTSVDAVIILDR
jgi:hypothetical protein